MAKNINTASDWLNVFTKVFGCSYSLQLYLTMATISSVMRELSQNSKAVQKRRYRVVLREKKRRAFFIHDYIRTKYPDLFTEANGVYQELAERYPNKADFTKTYYFKKWQKKIEQTSPKLFIPHLPILTPHQSLCLEQQAVQEQVVQEQAAQEQVVQEQVVQEQVVQEQAVQEPQQQEPNHHLEVIQTGVQNDDEASLHSTGMTLDEMSLAVEELVVALRSDQDLMDIVEGFDLPDSVWNNELAIPDYVLESELDW